MTKRSQLAFLLALGLLLALGSASGLFYGLDARIYDRFFLWRHQLGMDPPVDPRIVLVELDNDTFQEIGQPVSRWADDYARVISQLFDNGAELVAFDILYRPILDKLEPEDAEKIYAEVEQLALLALSKPLVVIDSFQQGTEKRLTSIDMLHAAAESQGNVAYNNTLTDPDGMVRSLGLFFYIDGTPSIRTFAGRLAELAKGNPILLRGGKVEGLKVNSPDRMAINYPGPPAEAFQRLKMSRLLQGGIPHLQGKICLIGPAYDTSNDLHNTPLNLNLGTWGLEIHASALNTILTEQFLLSSGWWSHILFTLVGVVLAYGVAERAPTQSLPLGGLAIVVIYLAFCFFLFAHMRYLAPVIAPLGATVMSGLLTALARYRRLENSRKFVRSVLGRFVSPQVMEELLASPDNLQLGGRRKRITVLFTDINNFTPLCEKRSPEEVIIMLNEFFNEMLEIIFRYNGTVKQFVGDEIMVMYGAPSHEDDHARRAVLTARDMVTRLNELKKQKGEEAGFYEVKVGIHTGEVVVGNVGNEKRSEYAAVGDPVNTAARIEGLTKSLNEAILLSEETLKEFEGEIPGVEFVGKGPQSFKGKADKMEVYGIRWS